MEKKELAIAFSDKDQQEAIREAALKIKLIFPKRINHLIILSTPHYNPATILSTIKLTLKPRQILGLQSNLLIFEDKILQKGIIICCINKEGVEINESILKASQASKIESFLGASFKKLKRKGFYFLSFASSNVTPASYIRAMRLSVGKVFNLLGGGFLKKVAPHNSQIANDVIDEGLINIAVKGIKMSSLTFGGYLPLGKSFTITKTTTDNDVILEIDNQPAINVYKHYLEEKFDTFVKNHLFSFYPLGITSDGATKLVNVIECLEDGSLACSDQVNEGSQGHLMFLDLSSMIKHLEASLAPLKTKEGGLVFVINSLFRKKVLKDMAAQEIKTIKQTLGDSFKTIGFYCDYSFLSDEEKGDINIEIGKLLLTLWQ